MIDILVRQAKANEVSIALNLLKQAAKWLQSKNISYWQSWLNPQNTYINWVQEGFNNNEFYFVYWNEELVGMFRLQWSDGIFWSEQTNKAGYVHSFTTVRKYYQKGIGTAILQHIEQLCIEKNKSCLRLDCGEHLTGLIKYYENFGFKAIGKTMTMGEDLVLFEKQLVFNYNNIKIKPTQPSQFAEICRIEQSNSEYINTYTVQEHRKVIGNINEAHFSIFENPSNKLIGFIILAGLKSEQKKIEFRRIAISEKGKGYGTQAINFVKYYCFEHLSASQIWLDVYACNKRAIKLYNKIGFSVEQTIENYNSKGSLLIMSTKSIR